MRWDYGKVYKEIRKSKGLTQDDICGNFMDRSTLARIEQGKIVPRFENMIYLLNQIDMSLSEFKYICNEYFPSERQQIIVDMQNSSSYLDTTYLEELLKRCKTYLKSHNDIPIYNFYKRGRVILEIRKSGIDNNDTLLLLAKEIWEALENRETWYGSELALLASIIFYFDDDVLPNITKRILSSLKRFKNYRDIKPLQLTILANLSTIFFKQNKLTQCEQLTKEVLILSKSLKQYDTLGFAQVRLGICQKDDTLINKGLTLLKLTEEEDLVAMLEQEVKHFYRQS